MSGNALSRDRRLVCPEGSDQAGQADQHRQDAEWEVGNRGQLKSRMTATSRPRHSYKSIGKKVGLRVGSYELHEKFLRNHDADDPEKAVFRKEK